MVPQQLQLQHLNFPARKRQRRRLELFDLPNEIIELIVFFIPDYILETYVNLPFLGGYAINRLYRFAEVSEYSRFLDSREVYKYIIQKRVSKPVLKCYLNYVHQESSKRVFKPLRLYQLVQFVRKYPSFKPKIVYFSSYDQFLWFHERYTSILSQLPRIDLAVTESDRSPPISFGLDYNIYRVLLPSRQNTTDSSKGFIHGKMLPNIVSVLAKSIPSFEDKTWGRNIQELTLWNVGSNDLCRIFPNLKRLRIDGLLDLSVNDFPRLPLSLQFLQINITKFVELDVTYLGSLREFVAAIHSALDSLRRFTFPPGIERVILWSEYGSANEPDISDLDSIELYPNLKEFEIEIKSQGYGTRIFSNNTFPSSLRKLRITMEDHPASQWSFEGNGTEVFIPIGNNLQIPKNLNVLQLKAYLGCYQPDKLLFPSSLRVLHISNDWNQTKQRWWKWPIPEENWSQAVFPDTLVELKLKVFKIGKIRFPKSLRSLVLSSWHGIELLNLASMENLVQLKIGWVEESSDFICKLPLSLDILDLSRSTIRGRIIIEASNLKQFKLPLIRLLSRSKFQIPACVQQLLFTGFRSSIRIGRDFLPNSLTELDLSRCDTKSKLFDQFQIHNYKNLVKLDLSSNKLSRLGDLPASLEYLNLGRNPIAVFNPTAFWNLPKLKELYLNSTNIFIQLHGMSLHFPHSLVKLDLSLNNLQPGAAANIILSSCDQLQELRLFGNKEMTDAQVIVDVVKSSIPNIVEVILDWEVGKHIRQEEGVNFLSFR
ncbi:uncharacterized protein J8A68_001498 [[Candida] subhashii]|uniref:Uncharacterized protein n=1 Tax=[Candida] subhashii TaxID=561895 RepID=A0A8J5UZQ6_9ASCO|nr:uncharacterized protein J8A68_001498 [[Candida] subhashii]KAG7664970.1 hypothetical protein J8A68_001498 [[Candida] subhashii]